MDAERGINRDANSSLTVTVRCRIGDARADQLFDKKQFFLSPAVRCDGVNLVVDLHRCTKRSRGTVHRDVVAFGTKQPATVACLKPPVPSAEHLLGQILQRLPRESSSLFDHPVK